MVFRSGVEGVATKEAMREIREINKEGPTWGSWCPTHASLALSLSSQSSCPINTFHSSILQLTAGLHQSGAATSAHRVSGVFDHNTHPFHAEPENLEEEERLPVRNSTTLASNQKG
ncbi:hypothetical protein Syun_012116 [Stephania yunnanensis]|uniref:Uncharacterized protein n=1 Tax=Stephania yunnanensis TaxID=152371 RepID=A0AAP0JYV4_9MAGN